MIISLFLPWLSPFISQLNHKTGSTLVKYELELYYFAIVCKIGPFASSFVFFCQVPKVDRSEKRISFWQHGAIGVPRWLFFKFDHKLPAWVFPVVDGLVGGLFLADWCLGRWKRWGIFPSSWGSTIILDLFHDVYPFIFDVSSSIYIYYTMDIVYSHDEMNHVYPW